MVQTFNEPAKVRVVTEIGNVPIGDVELGELIYDETAKKLYIKVTAGWQYVAFT